jgi:histidinol-phosphate aminotransferase
LLGFRVTPSVTNFILVHLADATAAYDWLLGRGILASRTAAYGLTRSLRISIGTEAEVRAVAEALAAFANLTPPEAPCRP